jgi:hypothetical protein
MPLFSKKGGIWNSGVNFFKTNALWKQINILFLKDEGVWKEADSAVSPVNLQFEVYGGKGQNWGINNAGSPPGSDPGRQGGNGGYTKVQMIIPTAYKITPYVFGGGVGGVNGGSASGFGIDGEWMVVAGGGAGAAGGYWYWPPALGGPGFVTLSVHPFNPNMHGSGGYNNSGSTGSRGANGTFNTIQDGTGTQNSTSGSGGGGAPGGYAGPAPGGSGGASGSPGSGGGGNIRIWKDQGVTSGTLNVNPEWSMTFVTSSNGTSPGGKVVITNLDTNGSVNLSGDMPVEDLKSI